MFRPVRKLLGAVVAVGSLALVGACGDDPNGGGDAGAGRLQVEASFYPLEWIAEQVGGANVSVRSLTKAGAEPHDLELTPKDVARVLDADVVVYLHGFQPSVDEVVDEVDRGRRFDAAQAGADLDLTITPLEEGTAHRDERGSVDPHFWLDPSRLSAVAAQLGQRLAELDPDHADGYAARARRVEAALGDLDQQYRSGLVGCARSDLVTSHDAFGYLARRYGLQQVGIVGLTPEAEPSPGDLAAVTTYVRDHRVGTIFFESLVSPAIAETVARETGATTAVLDPIEGLTDDSPGRDYLSVMRANLAALRRALGCP